MSAQRRNRWRASVSVAVLTWAAIATARGGEFRAVAQIQGDPEFWFSPGLGLPLTRLSSNGQTVVGSSFSSAPGDFQAWRWTPAGGFEWLPLAAPQQQPYWDGCVATAVSADGTKIFVSCQFDEHHVVALRVDDIRAYRYENGTYYALERPHDESYVLDVTPSGALGVGCDYEFHSLEGPEFRPYRWDGAVASELSWLAGGNCDSWDDDDALAVAVSDNGAVMVGKSGETWSYVRPVVWVNGAVGRLDLYGPECGGNDFHLEPVRDLSGDGQFAVGSWDPDHPSSGVPPLPVYWTIATRTRTFLPLPALHDRGEARCVSQDGGRIGGWCSTSSGLATGVLWNRSAGTVQSAADALAAAGIVAHTGWQLTSVEGISADGKQIVGRGRHPNGQYWIWWADLRNPPGNDACAGAEILNPNHTPTFVYTEPLARTGTTREATRDGSATCALSSTVNVWYKYTAPVAGFLELDLCDTASLPDGYIAVHTGCPGTTLNQIACSTACPQMAGCNRPCLAVPALELAPYVTYYIEVGGAAGYDFTLTHRFLPRNDDCAQAFSVGNTPSATPGTTDGMQLDAALTCQGVTVTAPGVWYTVVGTGTLMTAQTCNGTDYDTKLSVYCGGCGVQTCIGANDDAPGCGPQGRGSSVSWCSAAGNLYHIFVHGYASYTGNFQLEVFDGAPCQSAISCLPGNDTCATAITASAGTQSGDNTNAQTHAPAASCAPSTRDVWYRYVPRCDGQLWVDTCQSGGTLDDSVISLYDGCTGAELACNDDYNVPPTDCGHRSAAIASVVQDQEVAIRVAGYGTGGAHQGTFPLRITEVGAPLVVYGGAMPNAWAGTPYAYQVQYYGSCGRRFTSATGVPPGLSVDLWTGLISGTPIAPGDYVLHVTVVNNNIVNPEWAEADLTLRVLPSNDACAAALPITEGTHYFGTVGAATDGPPEAGCFPRDPQLHADVWFRYTASCTGPATIDLCDSNYDSKVAVYFGANCPTVGGTALACNDDACGLQSRVSFPVSAGVTYLIRIGGYLGAQGQGRMLLTCFDDCNNNGINDAEEIASGAAGDCNRNNRPDICDPPGDMSGDGVVSPADWPYWASCLRGPGVLYTDDCCGLADFDFDNDVDLRDAWYWMRAVSP